MTTILQQTGFLFPILLFGISILGFLLYLFGFPVWRKKRTEHSTADRKASSPASKRSFPELILFFLLMGCSVGLFFTLKHSFAAEAVATEGTAVHAAPAALATPVSASPAAVLPEAKKPSNWLDQLSPMIDKQRNFLFSSWGDGTEFSLDGRTYTHGIGMRISGTQFEGSVPAVDAPYNTDRYDCRQVYTEFALRSQYSALTFSIGADNGDKTYYGSEDTNGVAQVLLIDSDREEVLFDTDWVNYTYAQYDVSIPLVNVENLKIVYRTSGIPNKRPANRLQFVIVNPVLQLVED